MRLLALFLAEVELACGQSPLTATLSGRGVAPSLALTPWSWRRKPRSGNRELGATKRLQHRRVIWIAMCMMGVGGKARADETVPGPTPGSIRFEAALRTGVGLTFVNSSESAVPASTTVVMPVGVDIGIRINNKTFVGAFFQYDFFGSSPQPPGNFCLGTCTSTNGEVGLEVLWHPLGDSKVDPWLGIGTGYEWSTFTDSQGTANDTPTSSAYSGWEVVYAQAGVDFELGTVVKFGPYVGFSVTDYLGTGYFGLTGLHLTLGVRLVILP
jgi:hypothetical protein